MKKLRLSVSHCDGSGEMNAMKAWRDVSRDEAFVGVYHGLEHCWRVRAYFSHIGRLLVDDAIRNKGEKDYSSFRTGMCIAIECHH